MTDTTPLSGYWNLRASTDKNSKEDKSSWLLQMFNSREVVELLSPALAEDEGTFLKLKMIILSVLMTVFSKNVFIPMVLFNLWVTIFNFGVGKINVVTGAPASVSTFCCWCPYVRIPESFAANLSPGLFLLLRF